MKIIIDVMSGDNAPHEIIKGAIIAAESFNTEIIMVGNERVIRKVCGDNSLNLNNPRIDIVNAEEVITMEDSPLSVVREKSSSSMGIGLKMLAEGKGDAFVSAGNTGALHAGSTLIVRRIKGFQRSAIAAILPYEKPLMLIDSGANTEVTKEQLEQFAIMGSIYMEKIFEIQKPRVGLANIGAEPTKGTKAMVEAYEYLDKSSKINFVGNIEGKQIPFAQCDVLVCDGFTGNIILKLTEGLASFLMKKLKGIFLKNIATKLSSVMIKGQVKQLKNDFDPSEYGGAPMLGISKPVIKAHGSSDALAIKNAVRQAIAFINTGVIAEFARVVKEPDPSKGDYTNE